MVTRKSNVRNDRFQPQITPGGHDGNEFLDTVEMYDPITNVWTSIPNMTRARNGAGAAVIGDNLYAIGQWFVV